MEHCSVIKNKILSSAAKWMELEDIISEISQTSTDKCCMFFLTYENKQKVRLKAE